MICRSGLILLMTIILLTCGCTTPEQAEETEPVQGNDPASHEEEVTSMDDPTTIEHETLPLQERRDIFLKENPTTGYGWNITVSPGLVIETDEYVADPHAPGIAGSGGVHHWVVRATETGNQTFEGVYRRSWRYREILISEDEKDQKSGNPR